MKHMISGILAMLFASTAAQAVDFQWINDHGEIHALSQDYKDQPVLVHVWASWCGPCRAEMPDMVAWLDTHPEVNVLPVSLDSDLETAQAFLTSQGIALPALLTDQQQAGYLGIRGLPTTILIDGHGHMLERRIGMQDWQNSRWTHTVQALFPTKKSGNYSAHP